MTIRPSTRTVLTALVALPVFVTTACFLLKRDERVEVVIAGNGPCGRKANHETHITITAIPVGDPGWGSFYFGNSGTLVGDRVPVIHCDFNRAHLITNLHVEGKQMASGFFPITCTEVNPKHFILDATPRTVNLIM